MKTNLHALSVTLGNLLIKQTAKVAFVESCTGGMLSEQMTTVSGSSAWFEGSIIAYSNAVKEHVLNVSHALLEKYGAASEEVAKAMAKGVLEKIPVDYAVSVTGIAGPTGGTIEKPVGLVCFGLIDQKRHVSETKTMCFTGGRNAVRISACAFAINWLIKHISV